MRFLLAIAVVAMTGIVAGVVTGKAIAGTAQPSEELGRPGDVMSSGRGIDMRSAPQLSRLPDGDSQSLSVPSRGGVTERTSAERVDSTVFIGAGHPEARPGEVDVGSWALVGNPVYSNRVFQVSGISPSVLMVREVIAGDANLDGAVTMDDVLLVAQAMGSVPADPSVIVDWDGDGDVDVANLAAPASRLAG